MNSICFVLLTLILFYQLPKDSLDKSIIPIENTGLNDLQPIINPGISNKFNKDSTMFDDSVRWKLIMDNYNKIGPGIDQEGTVFLKLLVDTTGDVIQVVIAQTSGFPKLDSAAIQQAKKWKFKPVIDQGQLKRAWIAAPIKFELNHKIKK